MKSERLRLGLSQTRLAQFGGVSKTSQLNYESNVYTPDVNYLAGVTAAGVDPVFVLLGGAPAKYVATNFNWELAGQILELIEEWSAERTAQTPIAVKCRLLELLYKQFCADGSVDRKSVVEVLRLAS